jgi:uncharacterized pyridoxamine 5'-phosphate oxidase family protein
MQVREIELKAEKLGSRSLKIKRVKEKWSIVKFGDKEFLMPKELINRFTNKVYRDSIFHFYFDGDRVITDDPYHIPATVDKEAIKECRFIVVDENAEFWNAERYTLIAKENGLALYTTDDDNDKMLYRNGREYTIFFRYDKKSKDFCKHTVIFDAEKPLNEETFKLVRRIGYKVESERIRHIRYAYFRGFEVGIVDDDVDVYVGERHYIMALDNAEIVKVLKYNGEEELVAIKGDKAYVELKRNRQTEDEVKVIVEGKKCKSYVSKYRMFDYDFKPINVLKANEITDTVIAQVPSLDADITVKKFIINVEPVLVNTYPKTWLYEKLSPEIVEEKTYKLRDLVKKLSSEDRKSFDYEVDIFLAANA